MGKSPHQQARGPVKYEARGESEGGMTRLQKVVSKNRQRGGGATRDVERRTFGKSRITGGPINGKKMSGQNEKMAGHKTQSALNGKEIT